MNKIYINLLLVFLFLNGLAYYLSHINAQSRIDLALEQDVDSLETHYDILLASQEAAASAMYKYTLAMDGVLQILSKAQHASMQEQDILREELHTLLSTHYKIMREQSVSEYNFIFADNTVFYQAHRPLKFGNNLSKTREDIVYVNENKTPLRGFIQDETMHGFRNIFPLFNTNNEYLGVLEISFSSTRLQWYLNNVSNIHSHFIIHKDLFNIESLKKHNLLDTYVESGENENYFFTLNEGHTKEKCVAGNKIRLENIKDEITTKMLEEDSFSSYIKYRNLIIVVSFFPIEDISGETIAWIISYEISPSIKEALANRFSLRIISLFLSLLIIYFLYQQITSRTQIDKQRELLNDILDSTDNMMMITDFKDVKFSNKQFNALFNIQDINKFNKSTKHDILSLFIQKDGFLHKGLIDSNEEFISLVTKLPPEKRMVSIHDQNKEEKSFQIAISQLKNTHHSLVTFTDITMLKKELNKTEKKAYTDALTQVYNRNKFDLVFEEELEKLHKRKGTLSVALIDIDKFKTFNDTYGHLIGDEVLVTMAQTVAASVRDADVFARWGGEEFVILFKNVDAKTAAHISLKIKDLIEANEHPVAGKITASFGLSEYKEGDTAQSIFKRCDDALYVAKDNGRNRVEVL
ncbi:MAG: diguanylate cyclase [Sulfurimonas sp.]|nr:diguanylate cyclase [Sulfurimonas sp.]MDQ7060606.1 diguanylate cyclase [Sulfurimonas sp.]